MVKIKRLFSFIKWQLCDFVLYITILCRNLFEQRLIKYKYLYFIEIKLVKFDFDEICLFDYLF